MIQSSMWYIDVVFPVSLGPLTYACPQALRKKAQPGMIVSAPLRNKPTRGIIVSTNTQPPQGPVREIVDVHGESPVVSSAMLALFEWMADYYLASLGAVVKQTLPREIFVKTGTRRSRNEAHTDIDRYLVDIPPGDTAPVKASLNSGKYRAFLVQTPSHEYEYSLAADMLRAAGNAIVLLPEISRATLVYHILRTFFGERVCLLHSGLSRGKRSESIGGILSGKHDVVVGTGSALFAPVKNLSLLMVLREHTSHYKREEGIRYSIRDVAVMRGYLENATVLLSSVTPSIESWFNSLSGKYQMVTPVMSRRPTLHVVDMRYGKKIRPYLAKAVIDASRKRLAEGKRIMFVLNRRGYSILHCSECGFTESCPACTVPLVMHKQSGTLKCHYCGNVRNIPERCSRCSSPKLELSGAGTQRVQEDIEDILQTGIVRFDSDMVKRRSELRDMLENIADNPSEVIIGTRMMTGKVGLSGKFSLAALLNVDMSLNQPDFRALEKAYMEIASIAGTLEPEGDIYIQTRFPQNHLFRYLKANDYEGFVKHELSLRKALSYPPFSKMLNISFSGNSDMTSGISEDIQRYGNGMEVLGPALAQNKKGDRIVTFLLKSGNRNVLKTAARKIMTKYARVKGIHITVDVDPL